MEASIGQLENNLLVLLIPALPLAAAIIGYLFKRIGLTVAVLMGVVANLVALGLSAVLFAQKEASFAISWISFPDNLALMSRGISQAGVDTSLAIMDIPLAFTVNPKSLLSSQRLRCLAWKYSCPSVIAHYKLRSRCWDFPSHSRSSSI